MGWHNPPISWAEYERRLSGRSKAPDADRAGEGADRTSAGEGRATGASRSGVVAGPSGIPHPLVEDVLANVDEYPASRRRPEYQPPRIRRTSTDTVPYAELHCHSNFSFLDGASHPEELVEEAARLGLSGLALTDHDGLYGVVRFAEAARECGVRPIFGAELSLGLSRPQNGVPDPEGRHLLVLARSPEGYARLSRAISEAQLAGEQKGKPAYRLERLAELADGHWQLLTGCRKGAVPAALVTGGRDAAARELDRLVALFGADQVAVELSHHDLPYDDERNTELAALAARWRLRTLATNNVHYATPGRYRLATALAAVRARRSLDEADGWLPPAATAHLRSGEEIAARFAGYSGAVAHTVTVADECAFDLRLVAPDLPDCEVPDGHTEMSWLRELTRRGAEQKYAGKPHEAAAYRQIAHELDVIEKLGFPGYFLIVHDIVDFCRREGILCQGRGSAANSAVCYAIGITNVDAVLHGLLFERFLAPERDGPPDIDVDIASDRREEVIQHVYDTYGRHNTAQVANVISYRPRSAVRDIAKAFGHSPGQQDAWSKQIDRWGTNAQHEDIPERVIAYANELQTFPRHLGIHSGGMVICDRPVIEVCPVEWARMPGRTVLQWDKDDCAATGLVKFDLLGLGMLSALQYATALIRDYHGDQIDISQLPQEDSRVYDMLCDADSVGVFQVESRAQIATLPRLRPRKFYDLVIEVALIRPGPIQGGSVHPYIRRKKKQELVTYPHKSMEKSLSRTLGVPLFQEQLMQMAIDVAGFDATEADQLRRAMGSKRSEERMGKLKDRLYDGMAERGVTGEVADDIYVKLAAFANFGFPESHAYSFAYLVYVSSWLKLYYPAAFCASLLNAQPMGFYSPNTLVADARRHGVEVRRPDINASAAKAILEPVDPARGSPASRGESSPLRIDTDKIQRGYGECGAASPPAIRMGLSSVRQISDDLAERIVAERDDGGPYRGMADLARRVGLTAAQLEALATADAFGCFGLTRREALWGAGAAAQERADRLPGTSTVGNTPMLPGMAPVERAAADVWATGLSPDSHPAQFARERLDALGAVPVALLAQVDSATRVLVGGVVTHRQRPGTAGGVTFLNLEDETGMLNVVCSEGVWLRYRRVARTSAAMIIRGRLERADHVTNLVAERLVPLDLAVRSTSRDFR
ncbi:MAG: error-prone DNA polymerase [Micromonosporaceae bacterium]